MMSTDTTRFQCTYIQKIRSNMQLLFYLEGKQVASLSLSVTIMPDIHSFTFMTLLPGTLSVYFHAAVT